VGCDNELDGNGNDDGIGDDGDNGDDKSPDFGAGLGAIVTAGVRRPRAEASAAIAL
jgi:hypothetical protein